MPVVYHRFLCTSFAVTSVCFFRPVSVLLILVTSNRSGTLGQQYVTVVYVCNITD